MRESTKTSDTSMSDEGQKYLLLGIWMATAILLAAALSVVVTVSARAEEPEVQGQTVGGNPVSNGKYSFMVSLQVRGIPNNSGHFCGGTLIDRDSVLTAAHCVEGIGNRPRDFISASRVRVVVGTTVLKSNQGQERKIKKIKRHPSYKNFKYDAAVIQLDRPVSSIKPIKIATARQNSLERPGRKGRIAGWGNTAKQELAEQFLGTGDVKLPNRMQEARPPLVSDGQANRVYGSAGLRRFTDYEPRLMVAAGKVGVDSCQGDSGGPLFARTGKRYTQIGITSFGLGCAAILFPGVYAEVNSPPIRNFIVRAAR